MVVETPDGSTLVSVEAFGSTELIDGEDTAVIRLTGADGGEISIVVPLRVSMEMVHSLIEAVQSVAFGDQRPAKD